MPMHRGVVALEEGTLELGLLFAALTCLHWTRNLYFALWLFLGSGYVSITRGAFFCFWSFDFVSPWVVNPFTKQEETRKRVSMVLLVPYKGEDGASLQELGANWGSVFKGEVNMRRKTVLPVEPSFPPAGLPSGAVITPALEVLFFCLSQGK